MKITAIEPDSTAAELHIQPGDRLLELNGIKVRDIVDYRFRIAAEEILLQIERGDDLIEYELEKDYDDDLGLTFEDLKIRKCANDCIFCFVDQNPIGMRNALYFRDGDYRLSFLHGHYVTLTNMGKVELRRVVEQRMSPLYISVHVTDLAQRKEMFLYGKDDKLLEKLEYLTSNGIDLHTQIVLCPGWNDGELLERTVADLHRLSPAILSLAIVPVGLTRHRDGLPFIQAVDETYARDFIPLAHDLDQRYRNSGGERLIFLSDEWFIRAGEKLPGTAYYGDFSQVENGVGQVREFLNKWLDLIGETDTILPKPTRITIGSGQLIAPLFREKFIPELNGYTNLTVNYIPITNDFYGDSVTVSGLLTGGDIIAQIKGHDLGDMVIFSDRILSETGIVTLDDMDLAKISDQLGVPFKVVDDTPTEFFEAVRNG